MAVSGEQYARILTRLTRIEESLNDIMVAMENFVTMTQVQQLLTIVTTEVADLTTTVESLEERVESIESEPLS